MGTGAVLLLDTSTWLGQWFDTTLFLTVICFTLLGPFAAVSGHLLGRMLVGSGPASLHRRTLHPPHRTVLTQFGLALIPPYVAASLIVAATMFVQTRSVNGQGSPAWVVLAIALSSPLAFAALGVVLGVAFPQRLVAGLLPLVAYGLTLVSSHTASTRESSLLPVADLRAHPYLSINAHSAWKMLLWSIALTGGLLAAAAVILWHRQTRRGRSWRTWAVTAGPGLLFALAAPLSTSTGIYGLLEEKAQPTPLCVEAAARTACLWPGQQFLIPRYQEALRQATEVAGNLHAFPRLFEQGGLNLSGAWTLTSASTNPSVSELRDDMVRGSLGPYYEVSCSPEERNSTERSFGAVAQDLLFRRSHEIPVSTPADEPALQQLAGLDRDAQDQWLNDALKPENVCKPADLPR